MPWNVQILSLVPDQLLPVSTRKTDEPFNDGTDFMDIFNISGKDDSSVSEGMDAYVFGHKEADTFQIIDADNLFLEIYPDHPLEAF